MGTNPADIRVEIGTEEYGKLKPLDLFCRVQEIKDRNPGREVWVDGDKKMVRSRPIVKESSVHVQEEELAWV